MFPGAPRTPAGPTPPPRWLRADCLLLVLCLFLVLGAGGLGGWVGEGTADQLPHYTGGQGAKLDCKWLSFGLTDGGCGLWT